MYGTLILGGLFGGAIFLYFLYKMWKRQEEQGELMKDLSEKLDEIGTGNIRELVEEKYTKERDAMFKRLIEKTEVGEKIQRMNATLTDIKGKISEMVGKLQTNAGKLEKIQKMGRDERKHLADISKALDDLDDPVSWIEEYLKNEKKRREQRKKQIG